MTAVTDEQGIFRFPSIEPSEAYGLRAELQGFKKQEKTGIIVVIGQQSRIDLTLEQGKLEEEVTVVAVTPTVDAKKTSVGKNVSQEILQSLPTARDPWNVMQMAPSIIMDRENVGGSESGQQAGYYAKGDSSGGANNIWAVDGVVVTDNSAIGASPIYWDFDAFEEMNIVTGGADVTIQTGAVALNMVTRRGGNKVTLGGRFYLTDSKFQASNLTPALEAQGVTATNKINYIKDYGFNLGGPLWKDHAWAWMSYGVQDINSVTVIGTPQIPVLTDYNFKINIQPIESNRFEAFLVSGNKTFAGRSSSQSFPEGYYQSAPLHFGDPTIKLQDEQMFGNDLLLSAKFAYSLAAFSMIATNDQSITGLYRFDELAGVQYDAWAYITRRPTHDYDLHAQYYNDKLFGVSQEIKLGAEYSTRNCTTDSYAPGNIAQYYDTYWAIYDPTGGGNPLTASQLGLGNGTTGGLSEMGVYSGYYLSYHVDQWTGFFQDTITTGKFNILLGLRYDRQTPSIRSTDYLTAYSGPTWTNLQAAGDNTIYSAIQSFMPGMVVPSINPNYNWSDFSPRVGITYDVFGTGKTIFKLSASEYGDFMGTGSVNYLFNPYGASGDWMNFYWNDANHDGKMESNELFWYYPGSYAYMPLLVNGAINPDFITYAHFIGWGGFTPYSSSGITPSPYTVNPDATTTHTWEILFTAEQEVMKDFSVGLNATWRRYNHFSNDVAYYANGFYGDYQIDGQNVLVSQSSYTPVGTIPSSVSYTDSSGNVHNVNLGAGAGQTFYLLQSPYLGTPYAYHTLNNNYEQYWGLELVFNKRLSNKWMLDGSFSYMNQFIHYGSTGIFDPTNLWALQDELYAPAMGSASGKINQYIYSPWMLKLEGLYQLPYGFNISFTFNARAGHVIPHYMTITDYAYEATNPTDYGVTTYLDVFGKQTLPTFYQLNLRLEKMLKLGETGRIYLMADAFNLTNAAIINRRYDRNEGTLYLNANGSTNFVPYAFNYTVNEILNPFIMRLGVRFQF
jgi:hypothetical protein